MLLADVSAEVLPRSFLIAVVVVAPFGWWQWRKVKAARAARLAAAEAVAADGPESAPGADALASLESVVAQIAEQARKLSPGDHWSLEIPRRLAIEGTEADAALVDALVRDALRRDGMKAVDELDSGDHRTLLCVKQ